MKTRHHKKWPWLAAGLSVIVVSAGYLTGRLGAAYDSLPA